MGAMTNPAVALASSGDRTSVDLGGQAVPSVLPVLLHTVLGDKASLCGHCS